MKMLLLALLCALTYAQTVSKPAATHEPLPDKNVQNEFQSDAVKIAEAGGIKIDVELSNAKKAEKEWKDADNLQKKQISDFEKTQEKLKEEVDAISKQQEVLHLAEDKKNAEDSKIEADSINFIAAELVGKKKQIDKSIEERDVLINKYVPDIKKAGEERESLLNKEGKHKFDYLDSKLHTFRGMLDSAKEQKKEKIAEKVQEITKQKTKGEEDLKKQEEDHQADIQKVRDEMRKSVEQNRERLKQKYDNQKEKEEKNKTQLKSLHQKLEEIASEKKSALEKAATKLKETEENIESTLGEKLKHLKQKLADQESDFEGKINVLLEEKRELQKTLVRGDAQLVQKKATMENEFAAERRQKAAEFEKKLAELYKKLKKEKDDAVAASIAAAKKAEEDAKRIEAERLRNKAAALRAAKDRYNRKRMYWKRRRDRQRKRTSRFYRRLRKMQERLNAYHAKYGARIRYRRRGDSVQEDTEEEVGASYADDDGYIIIDFFQVFLFCLNVYLARLAYQYYSDVHSFKAYTQLKQPIMESEEI